MDVKDVKSNMVVLENELKSLIENFEKETETYVTEIFVIRDCKPWLIKVRTIVQINEPEIMP